jgi:DNA mismatch repair protein MLH3
LFTAKVVAQIDNKFICCAIRSKDDPQSTVLVLVDQHAADERVRVERFLREVLDQFKAGGVTSMALEDDAYDVQITKEQHDFLVNHPAATELLERWGFRISSSQASGRTGTATAVIDSVPTLLLSRLGAKGAREVTKIVSGYIAFLQTQPIGRMASLLNGGGAHSHSGLDTTGLLRWIPRRMKELVDSKACRGECPTCRAWDKTNTV